MGWKSPEANVELNTPARKRMSENIAANLSANLSESRPQKPAVRRHRMRLFAQTPRTLLIGMGVTLLGGCLWGMNATVSKILMNTYHATPLWIASIREIFAGLLFLACAGFSQPRQLLGAVKDLKFYPTYILGAFFCVMATQVTYLQAIDWTNSGTATVLQTLNLLFVLAIVCIRDRRAPGVRESIGILLAFSGTCLIATNGDFTTLTLPLAGLLWGLADAASTASMSVIPVKAMQKYGNFAINGIMFLISGIGVSAFVQPWKNPPHFDALGIFLMCFTVIGGTFAAYWLYMSGVMRIGAMRATMLGTSEPVMATISAVFLTASVFTPVDLVGFALILTMVFLVK